MNKNDERGTNDPEKTPHEEKRIRITDVDRDREIVYVHFGTFGQVACSPVENRPKVEAILHTDSLEPDGIIRIDDMERRWSLRELDNYFSNRRGWSIQELTNDEPFAQIGRWFIMHHRDREGETE